MRDKIEEIIEEVSVKHGITVGKNDPILIFFFPLKDTRNCRCEFEDEQNRHFVQKLWPK